MRKTEQVTGDWKKQHSEELHDLYCSPNITHLTTETRLRYGVMWRVWEKREMHREFWWGNMNKERCYTEHLHVNGKTTRQAMYV
jgi:hypothetical protein